jgi:hypothetical protein
MMIEKRLLKIRALYKSIVRINKQIENMKRSQLVTDTVRGGEATGGQGRGRVIAVTGGGHPKLPKKLAELSDTGYLYWRECLEVESWYIGLPEETDEDLNIKNIIYYYYFEGWSWKDIGAMMGYTGQGTAQKMKRYWCK